jgi:KUP system potassium uptake protein
MARQCVQLGFVPRLTVRHTSTSEEGQIYLPQVNAMMLVGVTILVLAFKTSNNLAAAYGIAVTGTFLCTSMLATVVFRREFHWSRLSSIIVFGLFFVVDFLFFTSNLLKVPEGGWVPLVLGIALTALMTSWKRGRDLLLARWRQDSLPLAPFLARLPQSRTLRVPGMAIFLTGNPDYVPTSLLHNLKHNKVLHEQNVILTILTDEVPQVNPAKRVESEKLGAGFHRIIAHYGFMEEPNVPELLAGAPLDGALLDMNKTTFFLSRETVLPTRSRSMARWRQWVFAVMTRNAQSASSFYRIPANRVVELGMQVEI